MPGWDICLEHLTIGYGDQVVLSDLSDVLPAGEITVILGGSGCGKSTLVRHMVGLSRPLAGSIRLGGQDVSLLAPRRLRRLRRQMGVLFQDGALLGALTLAENVALPLREHLSLPRATLRREALRVLEMVELSNVADLYPHQLSGGMRKRAGLARAIITNPRVLFCDEPTSGLDPITAARMDDLLLTLHERFADMTIVCVSHDLASLAKLASHVLVLKDGGCLFAGNVRELGASRDPYLVRFLARDGGAKPTAFSEPMQPEVASALRRWIEAS